MLVDRNGEASMEAVDVVVAELWGRNAHTQWWVCERVVWLNCSMKIGVNCELRTISDYIVRGSIDHK